MDIFKLFPIDVLIYLQFVLSAHIAARLIEVPIHREYELFKHNFFGMNLPTIYQCMDLCLAFKLCRKINFDKDGNTCILHSDDLDRQFDWAVSSSNPTVPKSSFPQEQNDVCRNHTCAIDEMCVPAATDFVCVKHEFSTVRCPVLWGREHDMCFRFFRESKTWDEAKDECVSAGGELLPFKSEEDYIFHSKWINFQLKKNASHPTSGEIWTGLTYSPVLPGWVHSSNHVTNGSDLCMSLVYSPQIQGWYNTTEVEYWKTVSCKEKNVFVCRNRAPDYWP